MGATKSLQGVVFYDENGSPLSIDVSKAQVGIDLRHHHVHAGDHFFLKDWVSVSGASATFDLLFKVGAIASHMMLHFLTQEEFSFVLYEGTTVSADGTAANVVNNKRSSTVTPTTLVYTGPTVTAVGTQLIAGQLSSGAKVGAVSDFGEGDHLIFATSTNYLLRVIKTNSGTHFFDYQLSWYEPQ